MVPPSLYTFTVYEYIINKQTIFNKQALSNMNIHTPSQKNFFNRGFVYILLFFITNLAAQANIVDGEILYKESCIGCHGDSIAEASSIYSIIQMKEKIKGCVYYLDLPWNKQDISDTAEYLDVKYFHLDDWN